MQSSVEQICAGFHEHNIPYAIMRNYEQFPQIGHDLDLVARKEDIEAIRALFKQIANEHHWDFLSECSHRTGSSSRHHTIEIFQFYRRTPMECLQVDIFHGFVILGLEYVSEGELLENRVREPQGRYYRIPEDIENLYRLFQIASLVDDPANRPKVARYAARFLHAYDSNPEVGRRLREKAGKLEKPLRDALQTNAWSKFSSLIARLKVEVLAQNLNHPIRTANVLLERISDLSRTYFSKPCGLQVSIDRPAEGEWRALQQVFHDLQEARLIPGSFVARNLSDRVRAIRVRERGGMIAYADAASGEGVRLQRPYSQAHLESQLFDLLVRRHTVLFGGNV
jgi:hypothetical protein